VIGVLSISVPYDSITTLQTQTTVLLVIIGTIIMVGGVILALIFGNTIIGTLQRAARQVSGASERIGSIAAQQASGSAQQVWAINAINQALQNFSETARDISQRTDQLPSWVTRCCSVARRSRQLRLTRSSPISPARYATSASQVDSRRHSTSA